MATSDNFDDIALLVEPAGNQYVYMRHRWLKIPTCLFLPHLFCLACTILVARA